MIEYKNHMDVVDNEWTIFSLSFEMEVAYTCMLSENTVYCVV